MMTYKPHALQVIDLAYQHLLGETELAWHIRFDPATDVWIPKSKSEIDQDGKVITVETWLVEEKDLGDYAV